MAFIAPKIVGGPKAPTPVGELGMVQMTQALNLSNVSFEQVC
jgi:diaminohydroxyphosphoribosylaminopyrimidine deaminase/5-amino-6-(5-phosphoribosylamino)uracil reductase